MSIHTFIGNSGPGVSRVYYGNAVPTAVDGNTYAINDIIENIGYPYSSAVVTGSPVRWICTTGGAGGTAVFASQGNGAQVSATEFKHVYAGGMAPIAATTGTDTAGINGTLWISEIFIPANMTITGVSYLIGSVGGTDKVIVALFNSAGAIVANSILDTSVTVGTTATFQRVPFTATYAAIGPGKYFVAVQYNGATAKIRTQAGGDANTTSIAQTFATLVAITVPTTWTISTGPIAMLY